MQTFIIIAIFIALGGLTRRLQWLNDGSSFKLNQFVIYCALPAVILLRIPSLEIDRQVLLPWFLPWLLVALSAVAVLGLSRHYGWSRQITGCLMMVVPLGNTSFFGFPMIKAFFGNEAMPYAIVYDQLGNFIPLAVYGSVVIAHYSGASTRPTAILKRVICFPPLLALLIALMMSDRDYPAFIAQLLKVLELSLVPLAMFLVGMHLNFKLPTELLPPLRWALALKLVLMPAVAALCCALLMAIGGMGSENGDASGWPLVVQVSVFQAAMPPMVTAGVMAMAAGLAPRLAAASIGMGLLASCLILPAIYGLLTL